MTRNYHVQFIDRGVAQVQECPMPALGPGELLIRAHKTLISPGTERAFLLGLPNTPAQYPSGSGYSHIGQVVDIGPDVDGWQVGDLVASRARHVMYAAVPANGCNHVPPGLSEERAAFFRLGSIAIQGVRKARIELGEAVAVLGCGLIGLLAMQLSRLNGGIPVISIDKDPQRLQFAVALNVDHAALADEGLTEQVHAHCGGQGPDVVFEATGHPEAAPVAFDLARQGGRVVLLGSTRGETEAVNFYRDVHKKGLTVLGAHESARPLLDSAPGWWTHWKDQDTVLRLLAANRLVVDPLLTHRFPWRDASDAYASLIRWEPGMLGAILDWTTP